MSNALTILRSLVIYSLCLPLAIFLGYLLAMPMDALSFTIVVSALCLPLVPLLMKHHHLLLFMCWNTSIVLFFLPGRPGLGLTMTFLSFMLSIAQHVLNRNIKFLSVPSVTRPLIFLVIVVLVTAKLSGGFGARLLGGESYGARRYATLLTGIVGYFAMTAYRVPPGKAVIYVGIYLLGTITNLVGYLAPYVSSTFHPIFAFFPVETLPISADSVIDDRGLSMRLGGASITATATVFYILARHGVGGLFDFRETWSLSPVSFRGGLGFNNPWRLAIFCLMIWLSLATGGFRGTLILLSLTFLIQFFAEGLVRTHVLPTLILLGALVVAVGLPLVSRMPANVQRTLSILPIDIDPAIRVGAQSTVDWRIDIWKRVLPSVPQYLFLGKGYAIDAAELSMLSESFRRSAVDSAEAAILVGDYHNGPLSVIIPLGIFGVLGFLWFVWAGFRVLLSNLRHGNPELFRINCFLFAAFAAKVLFFLFIFGSFYFEFLLMTSLVGLSVSINGGVSQPAPAPELKPSFDQFKLARANR